MLEGRECARWLHQLEVQVPTNDAALNRVWARAVDLAQRIEAGSSPIERAVAIEDVNAVVRGIGLAVGRWIPAIEHTSRIGSLDPVPMFGGKEVFGAVFSGGYPHATYLPPEPSFGVEVDIDGEPLRYTQMVLDSRRQTPVAQADDESQSLLVWTPPGLAYALDVTPKGGVTRTAYFKGRRVAEWQDARSGDVVMIVDRDRATQVHRISPGASEPMISTTFHYSTQPFERPCMHGGQIWELRGDYVARPVANERGFDLGGISTEIQLDCYDDTVLVLRHFPDVLERCHGDGCEEVFTSGHKGVAALLDDGRWIYAAQLDGIVGVWVEGELRPKFFKLADRLAAISSAFGEVTLVTNPYASRLYHASKIPGFE